MENFNTKRKIDLMLERIDLEVDDSLWNISQCMLKVEKSLGYEIILKSKDFFS